MRKLMQVRSLSSALKFHLQSKNIPKRECFFIFLDKKEKACFNSSKALKGIGI
ncbi:hypothetical protein AWRIB568_367 [Oenococcus oeni AWRIB568]|nr:hypothetical protein AWRIB318_563 [Oenococcus oeni AWRIB318]EJO05167.1 hypothetical protein AWRIB422_1194 [Oenococcus oeni AWRIB422]EJO09615.1 hypothetical protein AWRIB576_1502 [Oenococcus oeni AWRIB576]EJO11876.1 hypothetical protein AWRIB568_367 [Oenococcus oeni AWRIB568]EKP89249.1 hypothetical protein AWRIB202_1369 [Oenococcus oeni AWRIB202]